MGPESQLVRLGVPQTPKSKCGTAALSPMKPSETVQSSQIKPTGAGSQNVVPPMVPSLNGDYVDVEDAPPPPSRHKKVVMSCTCISLSHIFQTSNDYIREWLQHKDEFLRTVLDLEGPPDLRTCSVCNKDGIYRCSDCFGSPLFCTMCSREQHRSQPFHRLQQWTGCFFDDSSLMLVCDSLGDEMLLLHEQSFGRPGSRYISDMMGLLARSGCCRGPMARMDHCRWTMRNGWTRTESVFLHIYAPPHTPTTSLSLTSLGSTSSP